MRHLERHDARDADAERFGLEPPFCTAQFDFTLKPSRRQQMDEELAVAGRK